MDAIHADWSYSTNIYEVNLRQYTTEGTFKAFEANLPRLHDMGVETLWFMPVTPISLKDRKGTLGSYYAVANYEALNPEFGSADEFKSLITIAHSMGFKIIIDWVANWESGSVCARSAASVVVRKSPRGLCAQMTTEISRPFIVGCERAGGRDGAVASCGGTERRQGQLRFGSEDHVIRGDALKARPVVGAEVALPARRAGQRGKEDRMLRITSLMRRRAAAEHNDGAAIDGAGEVHQKSLGAEKEPRAGKGGGRLA